MTSECELFCLILEYEVCCELFWLFTLIITSFCLIVSLVASICDVIWYRVFSAISQFFFICELYLLTTGKGKLSRVLN